MTAPLGVAAHFRKESAMNASEAIRKVQDGLQFLFGSNPVHVIISVDVFVTPDEGVYMWKDPEKSEAARPLTEGKRYAARVLEWATNKDGIAMVKLRIDGSEGWVDPRWCPTKSNKRG